MVMDIDRYKAKAPVVLRIGIALLLLWFGFTNIFTPDRLVGYLSSSTANLLPIPPLQFMVYNGIFEVILGLALLLGFFTRIAAFITFLHIAGIGISLGYNDVAIRDIILAIAAFSVFLHGPDKYCLQK